VDAPANAADAGVTEATDRCLLGSSLFNGLGLSVSRSLGGDLSLDKEED